MVDGLGYLYNLVAYETLTSKSAVIVGSVVEAKEASTNMYLESKIGS